MNEGINYKQIGALEGSVFLSVKKKKKKQQKNKNEHIHLHKTAQRDLPREPEDGSIATGP